MPVTQAARYCMRACLGTVLGASLQARGTLWRRAQRRRCTRSRAPAAMASGRRARLTVVLCASTMPACQLCIVHREKARVHQVASNQVQMRLAPRTLWLVTCSSHPPVSCLQVDMFTGESAVLVSLKELFKTVLHGPQAGALLHEYAQACKQQLTERLTCVHNAMHQLHL